MNEGWDWNQSVASLNPKGRTRPTADRPPIPIPSSCGNLSVILVVVVYVVVHSDSINGGIGQG